MPALVSDDRTAELAVLFAALDEIEEEASARAAAAATRARRESSGVDSEIEEVLAEAHDRAEVERAEALEMSRRVAEAQARTILTAADAEAEQIRLRGRERIPALVEVVLRCVVGEQR